MKALGLVVSGVVAGIALIVACEHAGRDADGAPLDCTAWQYAGAPAGDFVEVQYTSPTTGQISTLTAYELAPGWEPFTNAGSSSVIMRRCKP